VQHDLRMSARRRVSPFRWGYVYLQSISNAFDATSNGSGIQLHWCTVHAGASYRCRVLATNWAANGGIELP
jgi:hypothetical protein